MTAALEVGEWSAARPGHTLHPVPILQEAGWAPGPVWKGGKSRPHRDSIPDRPVRSQSLYRLSYPTRLRAITVPKIMYRVRNHIVQDKWNTWDISKVLHTLRFLFKNGLILQNTFTVLQCNLHCVLSQQSKVWASLVFLSGRLRCWYVWLLGSPH